MAGKGGAGGAPAPRPAGLPGLKVGVVFQVVKYTCDVPPELAQVVCYWEEHVLDPGGDVYWAGQWGDFGLRAGRFLITRLGRRIWPCFGV